VTTWALGVLGWDRCIVKMYRIDISTGPQQQAVTDLTHPPVSGPDQGHRSVLPEHPPTSLGKVPEEPTTPAHEGWERFRHLAERLLRVPKSEAQEKPHEASEGGEKHGDDDA
jgi:hypothetical protein